VSHLLFHGLRSECQNDDQRENLGEIDDAHGQGMGAVDTAELQRHAEYVDDEEDEHPRQEDQQSGSEERIDCSDHIVDPVVTLAPPADSVAARAQPAADVFDHDSDAHRHQTDETQEQDHRGVDVHISDADADHQQDLIGQWPRLALHQAEMKAQPKILNRTIFLWK